MHLAMGQRHIKSIQSQGQTSGNSVIIMMLYISVRDHARKLNFSSYVHPPFINKMYQYCYA